MATITPDEARQLARAFSDLAGAVVDFHVKQTELSQEQHHTLDYFAQCLLDDSIKFSQQAVRGTLDALGPNLGNIVNAIKKMTNDLKGLSDVGKALDIIEKAIKIGGAILSGRSVPLKLL